MTSACHPFFWSSSECHPACYTGQVAFNQKFGSENPDKFQQVQVETQVDGPNKGFPSKPSIALSYVARQTPNRTSSTPPTRILAPQTGGGSEMCVMRAYWEVPEGGQKNTLLHPRPAIKTSKVPPKGPSRVPSAEPLRRFSVLVGNFIRKSKSPVPAPIPCFTGVDLK